MYYVYYGHSRNADECSVPSKEEGAIEDLKTKGEVLQWEERDGGTHGEQQALQHGQEQGQDGGMQVSLLLRLS